MLWTYRFITHLIYLASYPFGKGRSDRGNQLWKGRLGLISLRRPARIWLHASSVGEVRVTAHLVDFLLKRDPSLTIHLTTMTKAGFNTALKIHRSDNVSLSYFPFDTARVVKRTLDAIRPDLLIIAETEIWPNLICEASAREIPIVLVNARMTKKAHGRYRILRSSMRTLLNRYDRFFFKSEDDAARYVSLGVNAEKGIVVGDMKFDAPLLERSKEKVRLIRQKAGIPPGAFLFVAGSTRPGEEAVIANVFRELSFEFKNLAAVIAPRHVDRRDEIKTLLSDKAVDFALYGDNPEGRRVLLVDRMGILNDLYLAADLAFVGGTLVDIGGHNILEPVWAGCPVLFGPSVFNVQEASEYILSHNYGAMVRSEEDLVSLLKKVLSGDIIYATKQSRDLEASPTAVIGGYILEKLRNA